MSTKALKLTSLLFLLLLAIVAPLHAASNGSIFIDPAFTPSNQTPDSCDQVFIEYHFKLTADHNDGVGGDAFAITMTDGNGKALDTDFFIADLGSDAENTDTLDTHKPEGITARPITFALYDIGDPDTTDSDTIDGYNFARSGTLLAQTVFDPATLTINGTCENLPFVGGSTCLTLPAGSIVGNTPYQTQVYWEPGKVSPGIFLNPGNYWVIGTDESGKFYKIMLSCQFVWVPVEDFQPSFEAPQNGEPLPTTVVK
jgi:hypothetical protein